LNQWEIKSDIKAQSQVVFKTKEIKPEIDAYFEIICGHKDLPNQKYHRKMKSKGISEKFMIPVVEEGIWSCAPMRVKTKEE
jgi:hypothetical protein